MIDIELLHDKIDGKLTPDQAAMVDRWLAGPAARRDYFERLRRQRHDGCEPVSESRMATNRAIFYDNMLQADFNSRRKRTWLPIWGSAAAVAIFAVGMLMFNRYLAPDTTGYELSMEQTRNKTSNGAVELVTPRGERIDLSEPGAVDAHGGFLLSEDLLEMTAPEIETGIGETYKVVVRKGAEQSIRLSDGTNVWLNSHSELHYPAAFGPDNRTVFVRGEAYFEVAKEAGRPFIVSTGSGDIRVYGTEFNVNTRKNNIVATTLVRGSVSVNIPGNDGERMLSPGEMAEADRATGQIRVSRVDVDLYTGWRNGVYLFRERRIEEVLEEIALWHDLEVAFETPGLRNEIFSGSIRRDSPLAKIFNILEHTGHISFRIDGKRLEVIAPR